MDAFTSKLQKFENFVIAVCFIVMSVAAFAQVVNRNLIGASISWFDELARYCMVYLTLLATECGLRDGSQISITAVTDKCPPKLKFLLRVIVKMIVVAFSAMIFYTSITIIQTQLRSGQISAGLQIPMVIPYAILPVAFGLITIVQTLALLTILRAGPSKSDENNKESA